MDSGRRDARFVSRPRLIQSLNRHHLLKAIVAFVICGTLPDRAQVCVHAVHDNAHMFMKVGLFPLVPSNGRVSRPPNPAPMMHDT